ncbi:MAG TPA: alpha/beta hydrolase [Polyangiaceae bacterium]|jgi:pimeloyl-ACP methyl ester carboxylesterase
MTTTRSQDGTLIAFEREGQGPAVILSGGALTSRLDSAPLGALLAARFAVYRYDRRGRGDSGDTAPYAVAREVDDLAALIEQAGGSVCLFGHSSAAVLALEAASRLHGRVRKLALYEPPFIVDDSRSPMPTNYREELEMLLAEGRRGDAVEYFMNHALDAAPEWIMQTKEGPAWHELVALAHTLLYDAAVVADIVNGKPLPAARWAAVRAPTLVIDERQSATYLRHAAEALATVLPKAQLRTLAVEGPVAPPEAVAPLLLDFFGA